MLQGPAFLVLYLHINRSLYVLRNCKLVCDTQTFMQVT